MTDQDINLPEGLTHLDLAFDAACTDMETLIHSMAGEDFVEANIKIEVERLEVLRRLAHAFLAEMRKVQA